VGNWRNPERRLALLNRPKLLSDGAHAMIVDARDDTAAAFYRKYGFIPFSGEERRRLFLPMGTIRKLVGS
jgi:hypothetical protein